MVNSIILGSPVAAGAIEAVDHMPIPNEYVKLGLQVVLGIIGIYKLWKADKQKPKNEK